MSYIDRQQAIDALEKDKASLDNIIKSMSATDVRLDHYVAQHNQVDYDIDAIKNLPSVQLDPIKINIDHELTKDEYEKLRKDMADAPIVLQPERKTGRWLRSGSDLFPVECDQCGETNERTTPWCPHCGCMMEVEHE